MSSSSPTSSSSFPALIRVTHPPSISSVRAITPRVRFTINGRKIGVYHLPFLLLAGYFFRECYETSGKPYETALAHHKSQGYEPTEFVDGKLVVKREDFGTPKKGDKFEVKDEWGEDDGFGEEEEEEEAKSTGAAAEEKDEAREGNPSSSSSSSFGLFGEEPAINQTVTYEIPPTLPAWWLPDFVAVIKFSSVVFVHALIMFAQHWSVRVRRFFRYRDAKRVDEETYLEIMPHAHQGKPEITKMNLLSSVSKEDGFTYKTTLWCVFQRQRYEYVEVERDAKSGKARGELRELTCPVDLPISSYFKRTATGMAPDEIEDCMNRYGDNCLHVELPTFMEMFKEQLTGPVTVFQMFTCMLWLMDEYWKYALFNMLSMLIFEATTVFSRKRNITALRGIAVKTGRIYAFRNNIWEDHSTEDLVPGDIVSVKRHAEGETTIPCDCLILQGSAVVNEASLTGESVPQMKEAISYDDKEDARLDIEDVHKTHVLSSGTTLMQQSSDNSSGSVNGPVKVPPTPDDGCVCYVLRTGFSSTQGKLMRMMEFSSEQVTGDTKETMILLFILLVFACMASYHVFTVGMKDGKRSQYELVLRCILILTSVVPPELPMQTAMAVNTALLALMKSGVYCTEPFRVPMAGKIDSCLFDKTGTITSDKLVAVGVVDASDLNNSTSSAQIATPIECSKTSAIIIGGCHSLVQIDGKTYGDPLEQAALFAVKWEYDPKSSKSKPKFSEEIKKRTWKGSPSAKILARNHFASSLQRMSVVATVQQNEGENEQTWALVKGSPEKIATLLKSKPEGFDAQYRTLAEKGMRVIALAYKVLSPGDAKRVNDAKSPLSRDEVECDLEFAGFLAFACRVRTDSEEVINALIASSNRVMMATGDATLTALHVGNEVGIAKGGLAGAVVLELDNGSLRWVSAKRDKNGGIQVIGSYKDLSIPELAKKYSLCVTGESLNAASHATGSGSSSESELWDYLDSVSIFARMSPDDKERVLKRLKQQGRHTYMCGDGANDVGALKQAHVGVALLSGFGSANTKKLKQEGGDESKEDEDDGEKGKKLAKAETFQEKMQRVKEQAEKVKKAKMEEKVAQQKDMKELQALQKVWFEEEFKERMQRGEKWAQFTAMKNSTQKMIRESKRRAMERAKARQGSQGGKTPSMSDMMQNLDDLDGELPQVKLGDASMAAPFTSRLPTIRSAVDIIRQGRCTLVSSIQMQQVLVLSCLISAFSLSVLYTDGIRSSDNQMMASGLCLTAAGLAFSYATPVHTLSPVRPLRSIFHPALFLSIVGQLVIHVFVMNYATELVHAATGEKAAFPEAIPVAKVSEEEKKNASEAQRSFWEQGPPFEPCLLNTVIFLIETVQRVCVMLVNYKGRPFMMGSLENKTLLLSLASLFVGSFMAAFEVVPYLNNKLQFVSMPDDAFRYKVLGLLFFTVVGTYGWDTLCQFVFARDILLQGYRDSWRVLPKDPKYLEFIARRIFVMCGIGYLYMITDGSGFVLVAGYYAYKKGAF
jgi:cation-transporting ATPase 13A1